MPDVMGLWLQVLGALDNNGVAIVGDYDLVAGTGTIGAHGFSLTTTRHYCCHPRPIQRGF